MHCDQGGGLVAQKVLNTVTLILALLLSLLLIASLIQVIVGGDIVQTFSRMTLSVINIVFAVTIVLIIIVLVLENSSPVHTLAWIMVLIFLPIVGFVFYLFFGRNWRKTKLFNRKGLQDAMQLDELSGKYFSQQSCPVKPGLESKLRKLLERNSKALLTCSNSVEVISDTVESFSRLVAGISAATRHIHMVYFSIANDATGKLLKDLLIEKAKRGVEIRFIYDDVACWRLPQSFKQSLRKAGVRFVPFMPVWIPFLNSHMNYRNHRKLVIVDGSTAYLGGLNIGDQYLGKTPYFGYWRDSLAVLRGDCIYSLQAIFLLDWFFVSKENLLDPQKFEHYIDRSDHGDSRSHCPIQIVASGPDSNHANILQLYFSAISNAEQSIRITTPYLILNDSLLMALRTAAISGVKIQIILPGKPDHFMVFWGSRSYFQELMEVGVEIYEYQKGFMHAKILIVDDEVLGLGTANMDLRSFNHNFELTALIYDDRAVRQALHAFNADIAASRQVDLQEFQKRNLIQRSKESLCRLFSPLL